MPKGYQHRKGIIFSFKKVYPTLIFDRENWNLRSSDGFCSVHPDKVYNYYYLFLFAFHAKIRQIYNQIKMKLTCIGFNAQPTVRRV
jgi:hypothetical protein